MAVYAGTGGMVNGQKSVKNWNITDGMEPGSYVASNTQKGTSRIAGVTDWSGAFVAMGGDPVVMPGELFTFEGQAGEDPTPANSITYTGNAIVDSVAINWDFATGAPLEHTVNFSAASGGLTQGTGNFTDSAETEPASSCGLLVGWDGTILENVTTIALTISAANNTYVNSSTNCMTHRLPGPIDFTLDFGLEEADLSALPSKGLSPAWYIETAPSVKWQIKHAMVANYSGLTVDIETGAIINLTMNCLMDAIVSDALGYIATPSDTDPSLAVWWGNPGTAVPTPT